MSLNADGSFTLAVVSSTPTFKDVKEFPVTLQIDRQLPINGTASVINQRMAGLQFRNFQLVLEAMKRGRILRVYSQFGDVPFSLDGTFRALDKTYDCAKRYYSYASARTAPSKSNTAAWTPTAGQTAAMYQIATALIADAGLSDFAYLSADEVQKLGYPAGVMWRSPSASLIGGVFVGRFKGSRVDLVDLSAEEMRDAGRRCGGDIGTFARSYKVEKATARETRSYCDNDANSFDAYHVKMLVNHVLVETMLIHFGDKRVTDEKVEERKSQAKNAAIRAASFVTD